MSLNPKKLILIGAGGHAKSAIEVIEENQSYLIVGYTDFEKKESPFWNRFKYLGKDHACIEFLDKDTFLLIAVGMIRNLELRASIFNTFLAKGIPFASISAHTAYVSKQASLGQGTIVMHQAFVNAGVKIGKNCIVNTKALIEHDSIIGNHTHISTAACINADCEIGSNVFVSSNVTINRGIKVGNNCIIGSGSVVTKDIPSNCTAFGVPATIIEQHE